MNDRIFEIIDTKNKAYWLGFLYADGCIKNNRLLQLILAKDDEEQIDKFITFIDSDIDRKRYYGPYKSNKQVQVHFHITSPILIQDLISHGCTGNKTFTIRLPIFNTEKLNLAFLMGYYDGDGTRREPTITCGALPFLQDIKTYYNITNQIKQENNNTYKFCFGGELYRKMLINYPDSMTRKRKVYQRNRNFK